MNEKVLQAIIQLLAVSATLDGVNENERKIIRKFLAEQLNDEGVEHYMRKFDDETTKVESVNQQAVFKAINAELTQQQKIFVITNLMEMTASDGVVSENELAFTDKVAEAFHLDMKEYDIIKKFILPDVLEKFNKHYIVWVGNEPEKQDYLSYKYIFREKLEGRIAILRIPSLEIYLLKYEYGKNNVFLNGVPLRSRQIYNFSVGSTIRGDKFEPIYYSDVVGLFLNEDRSGGISFEAKDIWYRFGVKKIGLRNIHIAEESGKLIGLMGASGSGKSTLLNVLNGNYKPYKGTVCINGVDIHNNKEQLTGVIGYVPQDDLLIEELTVYQNLYYAAKFCFSNFTEPQIDELVQKTLNNLGLTETQDLKVGNTLQKTISGGQRKRLNIGLELLREPAVLFVDEPTSGLSSQDSENIMDLLKELSLKGKLIFVVIHQPSSDIFKMFDKLFVLDVGGYPIYYGNPVEGVTYFKNIVNLIDKDSAACPECGNVTSEQIFSIIENKTVNEYGRFTDKRKISPKKWNELYVKNISVPEIKQHKNFPEKHLQAPTRFGQWLIYLTRDILAKLSNTQYLTINLLEAPLLALILAYIVRFYNAHEDTGYVFAKNSNLPAYIFMSIIVALFVGLTVSAEEIIKDAKIRRREKFLNLSRSSYLSAKIAVLFAFSAIQALSFVLIGNWILQIEGMTFTYWLVMFSASCFANMLGLNISATFNSVITIYIVIPILLIPQLILGGIVIRFDEINPSVSASQKVPFAGEIMVSRWAYEALMVSQFRDNAFQKQFYAFDQQIAQTEYNKVFYVPAIQSKIDFLYDTQQKDSFLLKRSNDFKTLSVELEKPFLATFKLKFSKEIENLKNRKLTFENYKAMKAYLEALREEQMNAYNNVTKTKDKLVGTLLQSPEGKKAYYDAQKKYHNEAIARFVSNADIGDRIVELDNQLIQKVYPVYKMPDFDSFLTFRTHFFAPKKHFMGRYFNTLYFNVVVIWLMSVLLYATLYFNAFGNFLHFVTHLKERFFKRKKRKTGL